MKSLVSAVLVLTFAGCSSSPSPATPPGYFFLASHSGGGPAPYGSTLALYPDGSASYESARGRRTGFLVPRELFAELQAALADPRLLPDLQAADARSGHYHDHEHWWFSLNGEDATLTCLEGEEPPPALIAVITVARKIARLRTSEKWFLSPSECVAAGS
ncbi:MAG TPA: hypothetical protein VGF28_18330 [Thermoanaerobaculia bacterium]